VAPHLLLGCDWASPGLALLFTYLLHGAIWAAAAWGMVRLCSFSYATRNLLWRLALVGPVVTTLLTMIWPWNAVQVSHFPVQLPQIAARPVADALGFAARTVASRGWFAAGVGAFTANLLGLACGAGALLGLSRFAVSLLLLRKDLSGRRPVTDSRLLGRLDRLRAPMGLPAVSLTESARIAGPLVIGRAEVCLPVGTLFKLSDAQLDTVLVHELAHLERRDGLWFPLVGLVQSVLWMQPFNHLVSSRFRSSAELACDDRAVELTEDPLGLAAALTEVAASASLGRRRVAVPAMAESAHVLLERVRRLVAPWSLPARDPASRRWRAVGLLTAMGLVTVGLSVRLAATSSAAVAPGEEATARPGRSAAPDATAAGRELDELLLREQQLTGELARLQRTPEGGRPGPPASVRALELEQDLNHVRGTQAWVEARFVEEARTWEQSGRRHSGAAR